MKTFILLILLIPLFTWVLLSNVNYKMTKAYYDRGICTGLKSYIDQRTVGSSLMTIHEICDFSNCMVSEILTYSYNETEHNPNTVFHEKRNVNCVGYAALQTAVINYLIKKNRVYGWKAEQHSGKVYLGSFWLGTLSPKLGYHSYTVLRNDRTRQKIVPDACLYDILYVGYYKEI